MTRAIPEVLNACSFEDPNNHQELSGYKDYDPMKAHQFN